MGPPRSDSTSFAFAGKKRQRRGPELPALLCFGYSVPVCLLPEKYTHTRTHALNTLPLRHDTPLDFPSKTPDHSTLSILFLSLLSKRPRTLSS